MKAAHIAMAAKLFPLNPDYRSTLGMLPGIN